MKITCPSCHSIVQAADIQLDTGWAKCSSCQEVFNFSSQLPDYQSPEAGSIPKQRPLSAICIVEEEPTRLIIHRPPQGMRTASKGMLFFAVIWNGFITFWTLGALGVFFGAERNWGFAAFSIPFWLVGIGMIIGLIYTVFHSRTVAITPEETSTQVVCGPFRSTRLRSRGQTEFARKYVPKVTRGSNGQSAEPVYGAELVFDRGSFVIYAESDEEVSWLVDKINSFLKANPKLA